MRKIYLCFSVYVATLFIGVLFVVFLHLVKTKETFVEMPKTIEMKVNLAEPPKEAIDLPEILEENKDWEKDEESQFKVKLLETGEGFHGDEINAKSGETWLGLYNQGGKFFLKNSKLEITRVYDEIVDYKKRQKTGKNVSVINENQSVFLLKNADYLKEKEIKTLFGGNPNWTEVEENIDYLSLTIGFSREFNINNERYILQVKKGINKRGEKISSLILENEKVKQTLHSINSFGDDDNLGTLYWAGDLDSDGKPDFYFSLYFHDNVEYKNLFLSSKADKNKLVKKVAIFTITGC